MTFAHPWLLLLLLTLPFLAWLKGRHGQESAFLYSSVQLVRPIVGLNRSRAGAFLLMLRWLALALFIVALAQPRLIKGETRVKSSGIDIVVALDLSGSMRSEDFELEKKRVNRLTVAKDTLKKFVIKRDADRIGLVVFSSQAFMASPLTLDHDFLLQNIDRIDFGVIEENRTAIGAGLSTSLNRLREQPAKSKIVILMTDGQDNVGKVPPLTAAEAAQALGVKVYTIGVGIRGNAPMPYTDVFGQKRYQMVPVDIDEETLTKIAQKTGGKYFRADNSEALGKIYAEIDRLEKTDVEARKFRQYDELFKWFILAGTGFLLLEIVLSQTVWRKLP
ncbi:MAG: VWA domain-containing protein [Opitutaceae bacterium]|nr:VWA domain-containing protein [Verrucomicrobiales bacterium]